MAKKTATDKRILSLGQKLKKLRVKAGYTSYETFAFEHDIPRVQYWRLEKGANFTMKSLLKVLDIHKISMEEFFRDLK